MLFIIESRTFSLSGFQQNCSREMSSRQNFWGGTWRVVSWSLVRRGIWQAIDWTGVNRSTLKPILRQDYITENVKLDSNYPIFYFDRIDFPGGTSIYHINSDGEIVSRSQKGVQSTRIPAFGWFRKHWLVLANLLVASMVIVWLIKKRRQWMKFHPRIHELRRGRNIKHDSKQRRTLRFPRRTGNQLKSSQV